MISRNAKLTRFITKQAMDRFLHEIKQAIDDFPEPIHPKDQKYQDECLKLLLYWRKELREARDKLMGID